MWSASGGLRHPSQPRHQEAQTIEGGASSQGDFFVGLWEGKVVVCNLSCVLSSKLSVGQAEVKFDFPMISRRMVGRVSIMGLHADSPGTGVLTQSMILHQKPFDGMPLPGESGSCLGDFEFT